MKTGFALRRAISYNLRFCIFVLSNVSIMSFVTMGHFVQAQIKCLLFHLFRDFKRLGPSQVARQKYSYQLKASSNVCPSFSSSHAALCGEHPLA